MDDSSGQARCSQTLSDVDGRVGVAPDHELPPSQALPVVKDAINAFSSLDVTVARQPC